MASVIDPPVRTPAPPVRHSDPARIGKRVLLAVVGLIVLLVLVVAFMPTSVWKSLIVQVVSAQTHRQAAIDGDLKVHIFTWNPRLTVDGFRLANADWKPDRPMLTMQRFDVTVSLWSLIKMNPIFPRIEIIGPDVDLERMADNRANWDFSTPGAKQPAKPDTGPATHLPAIQQLILTNGKLLANDRVRKLKFNGQIDIAEKDNSTAEGALRVRGNGSLNEKPFELRVSGGPLINVDPKKTYSFTTAVSAADIRLTADTEIRHPFDLAAVTSKFHISGQDLADVYYLTELALPNTPPYDVSGTVVRDNLKFQIEDFKGKLGSSDISGKVSIDTGLKRPKLTADLTSASLDMKDLATPLGTKADAASKAGTLSEANTKTAAAAKNAKAKKGVPDQPPAPAPAEPELLLPDADLQVNRVRAMDADVRFDAASIVVTSKMPMKKVSFHLILENGKLALLPLSFTLPQGRLSGDITINARGPVPETDLDMRIDQVDLAQFKPESSTTPPLSGQMVGRIKLRGTGSSVHKTAANANGAITMVVPDGEMRAAFAELTGINLDRGLGLLLSKKDQSTQVRCAVFNFKADNGDLKADTLVLDTTHVLVTGGGDINLKDEAVNMSLKGKPKEIRIFRIRSPIELGGTLSHPKFGLEPAHLAAQAAASVALGTLFTPVASILAFVDGGLAKDANCAALIAQASQENKLPQQIQQH